MKNFFTKGRIAILVVVGVLVIDQLIKILVKTNMYWHESIHITDWFYIFFTENKGMAFGMEIIGKLFLSTFRIVAVAFIIKYLIKFIKENYNTGFIVCISFILAGAIGNIIDSAFYGLIFNESTNSAIAHFVPFGQGYESFLHGRVVDMFYFPIIDTNWPDWIPFVGGDHFIFFSPIFNFADASISCGFIALLLFYNKHLGAAYPSKDEKTEKDA